jgi:hypothetical protein
METRLTRRDGWLIAVAVLIAAASLLVGFTYFPRAFPEATIEFTVGREESRERAAALLDALGLDGHAAGRHAARFVYDDNTKVFLEKEMGLAQADSAFSGEIRLWRWGHRWFQVGEREEFRVAIATTGELAAFHHRLEEEAHGREIGDSEAEQLAGRFLATYAAIDLARFELVGSSSKTRPNRVDRTFTWELTGRRWAEAPLRLDVTIQGDRIGGFRTYLKIPETWHRDYEGLPSWRASTAWVRRSTSTTRPRTSAPSSSRSSSAPWARRWDGRWPSSSSQRAGKRSTASTIRASSPWEASSPAAACARAASSSRSSSATR